MAEGHATVDVRQVGLEPSLVTAMTLLDQHHGHGLYRIICPHRSFILKWFAGVQQAAEVRSYGLLSTIGVPTLPVYGRAVNALLLEDLTTSPAWRLATEDDVLRPEVGVAVAEWYRLLHAEGQRLLTTSQTPPDFLRREVDALDGPSIVRIGEQLGLAANPVWQLAAEHYESLAQAIRLLPTTLTYNDFHWTNLALSREAAPPLRAIIFDYHLLGLGPSYADYRNVSGALGPRAREAFQTTYGAVDARAALLDGPTSILSAIHVATQLPQLPGWAHVLVRQVIAGELEAKLRQALAVL